MAGQLLREASLELARLRRIRGAYRTTWRRIARAKARLAFAAALLASPLAEPALAGTPIFRLSGLPDVGGRASPDFADIDGDGDLDAFVGEEYGNTIFFENTGTASAPAFAAPSTNPFALANVGLRAFPTFADIDSDGDLDAFIGHIRGGRIFFENVEIDQAACIDGLDNDSDSRIDSTDPGCASASDTSERSNLQCDNGLDDDGDGKIDWAGSGPRDPQCASLTDNRESPDPSSGCGFGPELLLLAPALAAARRRLIRTQR